MTGPAFSLRLTRPAPAHDSEAARYARGQEVLQQVAGQDGVGFTEALAETASALVHHVVAYAFGDVYADLDLGPRDRQLVTIGALTALGGCERQLQVHVAVALNVGLTTSEIVGAVTHAAVYAGMPRALNAMTVVNDVLERRNGSLGESPRSPGRPS